MPIREILARMPMPWFADRLQAHAVRVDLPIEPPHSLPAASGGCALPVHSVDELLAPHAELLGRLKLCYGSDRPTFEKDLLAPVRAYASYVGSLPATADNYFCEPGGLLRLGLEVGFVALQATDGHIVCGRSTISARQHLEPRWRHATFLAGLCTELHRTLSHVVATDEQGQEWPVYLQPLSHWLGEKKQRQLFVRWPVNAQEFPALGLCALMHVVPPRVLQHLAAGNNVVVPQLISTLAGSPLLREPNMMAEIVRRSAALVIDRDLITCASRTGRPVLGAHLERYIVDVMRRLVVSHPAWAPNGDRSRVWLGREGLFIVWPNAASEIRRVLDEDETPGMPRTAKEMQDVLVRAAVLEPYAMDQPLWTIAPPPGGQALQAIKLASPDILLPVHAQGPRALTAPLVQLNDTTAVETAAPASQPSAAMQASPTGATSHKARQGAATSPAPAPPVQPTSPAGAAVHAPVSHGPAAPVAQEARPAGALTQEAGSGPEPDGQLRLPGIEPAASPSPAPPAVAVAPSVAGDSVPCPCPPTTPDSTSAAPAVTEAATDAADQAEARHNAAPQAMLALDAPMRLNRKVRDALVTAIDSLNGKQGQASAITISTGVFVPLSFLRVQGVEVPVALRELAANSMVATRADGRAVTEQQEFGGERELGVVLKPSFVKGLDPGDFTSV